MTVRGQWKEEQERTGGGNRRFLEDETLNDVDTAQEIIQSILWSLVRGHIGITRDFIKGSAEIQMYFIYSITLI